MSLDTVTELRSQLVNHIFVVVDNGAKVNATNDDGLTPIYDGVKRGDYEIVKELLDRGANKNIKPYKGCVESYLLFCFIIISLHVYLLFWRK